MKKCIDKAAIDNILHKLWKKDTGFEYIDIAQIAYNRALQDVQCEIDTIEVQEEPVSEDKMTISKEWFEHCKKSWYNEGYIDGEYNRDRQFEDSVSEELEKEIDSYFAKWLQGASDEGCFNSDSQLVSIYDCHRIAHHFAEWQKQQMMAKAINTKASLIMSVPSICISLPLGVNVGDKVKVIVIKED